MANASSGPRLTGDTFRFFRDLARNNRTEWMNANRDRYQAHVVQPFRALLAALEPAARQLNPRFDTSGRTGKNFSRINRDIRFARDKSPYRPQMYLLFSEPAPKGHEAGQLYLGAAAAVVTLGFRVYGGDKASPLFSRARPRALAHPRWLAAQAQRLGRNFESYWYSAAKGEWVKHDGWPLRAEDWARIRGWIVRRTLKPAAAAKPGFLRDAEKTFRTLWPLWQFTSAPDWKP